MVAIPSNEPVPHALKVAARATRPGSEANHMQIIPLTQSVRDAWDAVTHASDDAWMHHGYDWCMEVSVGVWGNRSLCFLVVDRDRIVGICPLFLQERRVAPVGFRFLSSGFGLAGPALINGLDPEYRATVLACAHAHVDALAREHRVVSVEFALPPLAPAYRPPSTPEHPLLAAGFSDRSTSTLMIDLTRPTEDLFMRLTTSCRNQVRQAMRSQVSIRPADRPGDLDRYYALHRETYRRTGVRPHPRAYFDTIVRHGWANVFFAEYDSRPISAINIAVHKDAAAYWTGASATAFMHLRPANLLQWHAIQWAKERGCSWYEVGEVFPGSRDAKERGLSHFKGGFGGALQPFFKGRKVYRPHVARCVDVLRGARRVLTTYV